MVDPPSDAKLLSDTEVADSWIDAKRVWMQGGLYIFMIGVSCFIIANFEIIHWNYIAPIIAVGILGVLAFSFQKIAASRNELDVIAISTGHPWHDSESIGRTTVYVLSEDKWVSLDGNVRLVATRDPILEKILLRDGDSEGKILARWSGELNQKVVAIINMAQALANAQDRDEGAVDTFESAREREETSEGVLDREWMATEEGSIDYEPGAILRAFKQSKDSEDGSKLKNEHE
jgi:hypothetical protein